jgi:hypothetical protein
MLRKVAKQYNARAQRTKRKSPVAQKSAHVSMENLKRRLYRTEKETVEIAGEEAQVEIGGGCETIEQRRDGVQNEHRLGLPSHCVENTHRTMIYAPAV